MNNYDYKRLCPFKWFVLENFPFIEADFDALTNWQLFCKIGKEINKIIEKVNLSGEQVEALTNAFNALETYVNNYFENLDVQEEINNKLDEMAESGELTDIIAQYLQLAGLLVYNTKADLKNAENLANGSIAFTIGETTYNDGMSNYYKIRTITSGDVVDDNIILALAASETLIAERLDLGTKLNVVDELPLNKENNAEYKVKLYEETINEIPESQHEYVVNDYENLTEMGTDYLKVGTWNIFVENSPYNKNFTVMDNFAKLRKIFDKIGANILGLNECTSGTLFTPANLYLTEYYKYFEMYATWLNMVPCVNFGNAILSHAESDSSTGARFVAYADSQHQGYVKNVYTVKNNKKLSFYSVHLSLDQATRITQIGELHTIISADTNDYIIFAGDFNYNTEQNSVYLADFINDGFKCANNGNYKTYDDSRNIGIDEIVVSNNIDIIETHNIENIDGASDHFPIYSKIKLN